MDSFFFNPLWWLVNTFYNKFVFSKVKMIENLSQPLEWSLIYVFYALSFSCISKIENNKNIFESNMWMPYGFIIYIYHLWWFNNTFYFDEFQNLMNLYLLSKIIVFICFYFTFLTLCWKARMRSSWESLKNAFPFVIFESILHNNLLWVLFLGLLGLWFYISLLNPIHDFQN